MRKETQPCVTQQKPVKEQDVKRFQEQQHDQKSCEKLAESKSILNSVQSTQKDSAAHEGKRDKDHPPPNGMLTRETLRLGIRNNILNLLW